MLDEERLETRLGDLEPADRRAALKHRRQDRVGLGAGEELELGAVGVVADGFDARKGADPFRPERRLDGESDRSASARAMTSREAAR